MTDARPLQAVPAPNGVDLERIERAVREILFAIGEDPERDGLGARRVASPSMYAEIFAGLHEDPSQHLVTTFEAEHDEMVMVRDIPLYSICEHHLIPFHGTRTSRTSRTRTVASPASRSWRDSSTATPSARRYRNGSPRRSPTRSMERLQPARRVRR